MSSSSLTASRNNTNIIRMRAKLLANFQGSSSDELSSAQDTIVEVLQSEIEPGWSKCQRPSDGATGLIPSNFLQALPSSPRSGNTMTANNSSNNATNTNSPPPIVRKNLPSVPRVNVSLSSTSKPTPQQLLATSKSTHSPLPATPNTPSSSVGVSPSPRSPALTPLKKTPSFTTPTTPAASTPSTSTTANAPSSSQSQPQPQIDDGVSKEMRKRRELVKEVIKTEENYVQLLCVFWDVYASKARQLGSLTEKDWYVLFGNLEQILGANRALLQGLKTQVAQVGQGHEENCCIGKVFMELAPYFKMYTDFINNYDAAIEVVERLSKHKYFVNYLLECEEDPKSLEVRQSVTIHSLLINPVQRIPRYQLLLQSISEVTEESHPDHSCVLSSLKQICEIAQHCNQSKAVSNALGVYYRISNLLGKELGFDSFIQSHRRFICEVQVTSHITEQSRRVGINSGTASNGSSGNSTSNSVAQNLKKSLKRIADATVLGTPRASVRSSLSELEEIYNVYLFNDALVIERDSASSDSKFIELFFLVYTKLGVVESTDHPLTISLETIANSKKYSLHLKPKEADEDYMLKFEILKRELSEAITAMTSKYEQRLNLGDKNLSQQALERIQVETKRRVAQKQLNDSLLMCLDSRKKLHTLADNIEQKEEELRRVQEELKQLREDKKNFSMLNTLTESNLRGLDQGLQDQLQQLSKLDGMLVAGLNDESLSFQKVFSDEPCIFRAPESSEKPTEKSIDKNNENSVDLYGGHKVRRRGTIMLHKDVATSIVSQDYSAVESSSLKENIMTKYGDQQIFFSSVVYVISDKGVASMRRLLITDVAMYIFKQNNTTVRVRVPLVALTCASVSTLDDNFFCLHSAEFFDFLFFSMKKTEIIAILSERKLAMEKEFHVQVATSMIFSPAATLIKRLRVEPRLLDCDFEVRKQDNDIWRLAYDPNSDDASFRMNKNFLQKERVKEKEKEKEKTADTPVPIPIPDTFYESDMSSSNSDVYKGAKVRRRVSIDRKFYGDYVSSFKSFDPKKLPDPSAIKFFDEVQKVNENFKVQTRYLIITEKNLCYLDPGLKHIKGCVALADVESISVSPLSDNYFCIHVSSGMDLLISSEKKTEILTALQWYCKASISITNTFNFRRKMKTLVGTFVEDSTINEHSVFTVTSSSTFTVTVSRKIRSPIMFEVMELQIDGLAPIFLSPDSSVNASIKLCTSSTYFTCNLNYYVLGALKGYHVEQVISSLSSRNATSSSVSIEDAEGGDNQKRTISLKRQKVSVNFGKLGSTTVRTKVVDPVGNEVCSFKFSVHT